MVDGGMHDLPELETPEEDRGADAPAVIDARTLEPIAEVPIQVSAVLGRATMSAHQLLKLGKGAVIELDRKLGQAIEVYLNNRLVARGEVVIVDERLGVTMTEIVKDASTR